MTYLPPDLSSTSNSDLVAMLGQLDLNNQNDVKFSEVILTELKTRPNNSLQATVKSEEFCSCGNPWCCGTNQLHLCDGVAKDAK